MQIHEITKINEGFMDAIKGIGSVAAQGVNKTLGTNLGGVTATAQSGLGQTQGNALKINTQLAKQQADQYAKHYIQTAAQSPSGSRLQDDINRALRTLMPSISNWKNLPNEVEDASQDWAKTTVEQIQNSLNILLNPNTPANPRLAQQAWEQLTTAAATAQNLKKFSPAKRVSQTNMPNSNISVGADNRFYYKGQPIKPGDREAMDALAKYLEQQ